MLPTIRSDQEEPPEPPPRRAHPRHTPPDVAHTSDGFLLWPEWVAVPDVMLRDGSHSSFWRGATQRPSIKRGKTGDSAEGSSGRGRSFTCPLHPGSRARVAWDVIGLAMLTFDIVWLPLQVLATGVSALAGIQRPVISRCHSIVQRDLRDCARRRPMPGRHLSVVGASALECLRNRSRLRLECARALGQVNAKCLFVSRCVAALGHLLVWFVEA